MYLEDQKKEKPRIQKVQNVRITPEVLEFVNPCEGSTHKKTICIQNIGHSSIFIKIDQPSSCAYTIKGTCRGQYLSPGLNIVKTVSLTYTYMSPQISKLPIFIDRERYEYELRIISPKAVLKYEPNCIDFGIVDSGFASITRCLHLRNEGSKNTRFVVDVGRNDPQLIVEPNKGILQPRSSVDISLKLISFKEGRLMPEFWIISETPIRIPLKGVVIVPKLLALHPNANPSFTLLDFNITYIGVRSVQALLVQNCSSRRTMFCVMGLINNQTMSLKAAEELDSNFKHFEVFPKDGRLESKETRVFYFTFCPQKLSRKDKHQITRHYNFCGFQICRIACKDLDSNDYTGPIFTNGSPNEVQHNMTLSTLSVIASLNTSLDYETEQSFSHLPYMANMTYLSEDFTSTVTVYLHGIPRTAAVKVIPTEITLTDLRLSQQEKRVLKFRNMSDELPIILQYKKVAFIDLDKRNVFLKPSEEIEVSVIITPHVIGTIKTKMKFDLLFHDNPKINDEYKTVGHLIVPVAMNISANTKQPRPKLNNGLAPDYVKEVGVFCENVTFENRSVQKPKSVVLNARLQGGGNNLIAFPNDTQRSIRPWRNSKGCITIFTGMPRYVAPCDTDYELTPFDQQFKNQITEYYTEYTRNEAKKLRQLNEKAAPQFEDYDLTNQHLLLSTDVRCPKPYKVEPKKSAEDNYFLPLTPSELNQIVVSPRTITTGKIVVRHCYNFKVYLKNGSSHSIHIFIKSNQGCIFFPNGDRKIVKANCDFEVTLTYKPQTVGFYTVCIDFIVNGSNVFPVTLMAEATLKSLKLNTNRLEFECQELHKYIDIYNPLNANISFFWNREQSKFSIEPTQGVLEPYSHITCCVTYLEYEYSGSINEVDLTSGDKNNQSVQLITKSHQENCFFVNNVVTFDNIPLNKKVLRKAVLKNATPTPYTFKILNPDVLDGVSIYPTSEVIKGNSEWVFYVTAKIKACVKFSCLIKVEITKSQVLELQLRGKVVYPEIKIHPTCSQLRKIPSSSIDSLKFTFENLSVAEATIRFDFSQHHEFHMSESRKPWMPAVEESLTLAAKTSRDLYLHFKPSDVSIGSFYLPILINDIIGIPVNTEVVTTRVDFYISTYLTNTMPLNIPTHLCLATIRRHTFEPKVKFSKTFIKFTCDPWNNKCISTYVLTVANTQKERDKLCIRIEELGPSFSMDLISGEAELMESFSFVCDLEPKAEIAFQISFQASQPGEYTAILPVYLESDQSAILHNYIHLVGVYPQPTITCEEEVLYFKPCLLRVTTATFIYLKMAFHLEDCSLQAKTSVSDLSLKISDDYRSTNKKGTAFDVKVEAIFMPQNPTVFQSTIDFTCTCGVIYMLPIVGASENSYLTNHAFFQVFVAQQLLESEYYLSSVHSLMSTISAAMQSPIDSTLQLSEKIYTNDFFPSYPAFPMDSTAIAFYMKAILRIAESWVYTQGFYGKHFYCIPEGIKLIPDSELKSEQKYWIVPFVQLLINLVGNDIITYLKLEPRPSTFDEQVLYCYSVYKRALIFLKDLGAVMPHVYAELLLNHSYFEYFASKYKTDYKGLIMDSRLFHYTSKQVWLDLILQTYKVLILQQLTLPILPKTQENLTPSQVFAKHKLSNIKDNRMWPDYIYTENEIMLLQWLEFNYNLMIKASWTENKLGAKEVNSFENNLDDGLVFIATTTNYCPYLISHMQEVYLQPSSSEQNFHNAIKVTQCWEQLNLSFRVTPQDLVKRNAVQMLMLTSYLFEVLPNLYPQEIMNFQAGLSETTSKYIKLSNVNFFPIGYKVIFFNNEEECFSTNLQSVTIQPRKTSTIQIKYKALFARVITVTMVLSGECTGLRYCKSRALTLIGEPDVTYMTSTLTVPIYLYKSMEVSLTCVSPYYTQGIYQLFLTYDEPKSLEDVFVPPGLQNFPNMMTERFHPYKTEQVFNEDGVCQLEGLMCAVLPTSRTILCYFHNKDIGDFAIKIITKLQSSRVEEELKVVIPKHSKDQIPLVLKIPNINTPLWEAFKSILIKLKTGSERSFWNNHLSEISTMRLVKYFLSQDKSTVNLYGCRIFSENTYAIKAPKNCELLLPASIYIEDECNFDHQEIEIGLKEGCSYPSSFSFSLESEDRKQYRYYIVKFVTK